MGTGGSLGTLPSGACSSHRTGRAIAPPPAARGQEGAQAAQDEVLGETAGRGGMTAERGRARTTPGTGGTAATGQPSPRPGTHSPLQKLSSFLFFLHTNLLTPP